VSLMIRVLCEFDVERLRTLDPDERWWFIFRQLTSAVDDVDFAIQAGVEIDELTTGSLHITSATASTSFGRAAISGMRATA
jgi:hypothetical protein